MRRGGAVVALTLLAVLSGCSVTSVTPTERPLPERPEPLTADSAVEYVAQFERAHAWNSYRGEYDQVTVTPPNATLLNRTGGGYVVHVEYTVGLEDLESSEKRGVTANYFVDGSVTRRVEGEPFVRPGPDPRNGTVVAGEPS